MKKICSALAFFLMMTTQHVAAVEDSSLSKSECQKWLGVCGPASKNLVETDPENCGKCLDLCEKAKLACAAEKREPKINEKVSHANENLSQAVGFHLWCKNKCRPSSSRGK